MRTLSYFIVFAWTISASLPLAAGVIERDFLTPGDGLLTYDDVNQREWLDLSYAYTSLENVKSKMVPGEFLEDFNFATEEDVRNLNLSAGPSVYHESGIDDLIDSLGFIFRGTGGVLRIVEYTLGQVAIGFENNQPIFDDTNVVLLNIGGVLPPNINPLAFSSTGRELIVANPSDYEGATIGLPNNFFASKLATNDNGPFWLFRAAAIPEPASIILLAIGVIAALSTRSRRFLQTSTLTSCLLLFVALPLNAGVVERDFLTPGDGLLTFDDVNQREWLDLTYSFEMELATIQSQMNPAGVLENFKFATLEDIKPFALSAEVSWDDNQSNSNVINPILLPGSQETPSPGGQVAFSPGAKNLIDLLGIIFTIQETYTDVTTGTQFTITNSSSYGKIAQDFAEETPFFDGTNVSVYLGETLIHFVNGTSSLTYNGRITTEPNNLFPQTTGNSGPFWLYRNVVPEPKPSLLLAIGITALLIKRSRP